MRQFFYLLGNPCDSLGNRFVCVVPIDRMNSDSWPTRESLEATSVAEDQICRRKCLCFFPDGLKSEALVHSYLNGRGFFPPVCISA